MVNSFEFSSIVSVCSIRFMSTNLVDEHHLVIDMSFGLPGQSSLQTVGDPFPEG